MDHRSSFWRRIWPPSAYVITPVHGNAVTLTWAFYDGGLNFIGTIPVTAAGTYNVPLVSYYHSMSFFGRSANVTASLPYGVGTFEAAALGKQASAYHSGLADLGVRFSVNLLGAPSMSALADDFRTFYLSGSPLDRQIIENDGRGTDCL